MDEITTDRRSFVAGIGAAAMSGGDWWDRLLGNNADDSGEYRIILGTADERSETSAAEKTAFVQFDGAIYRAIEDPDAALGGEYMWDHIPSTGPNPKFETARVGDHTELLESDAGSTIIRNNADKPINIQLYPSGRAYLSGNTTTTTISQQNTWYQIEGSWSGAHLNYLSHDGAGVLTYEDDVQSQVQYQVIASAVAPTNNVQYEVAIFKDGELKPKTVVELDIPRSAETKSTGVVGFTDNTDPGMSHSFRVRNISGTENIEFPAVSFALNG